MTPPSLTLNQIENKKNVSGRIDWWHRRRIETRRRRLPQELRIRQPRVVKVRQVRKSILIHSLLLGFEKTFKFCLERQKPFVIHDSFVQMLENKN